MSGERGARSLQGEHTAWTGHVREYVGVISPDDNVVFDPPLRLLYVGGAGNVVLVYDGDIESNAANRDTRAVTAGQELTYYAIRQVRATGTTATGLKGYR